MYEIIEKLRSVGSTLEKVKILKENESDTLKKLLYLTLNPWCQFFIRKIPEYISTGNKDLDWALNQLEELSSRRLTGHAGRDHLQMILNEISYHDALCICRVIGKDLKAGTGSGLVNKAFPDLIPKYEIQLASGFDESKLDFDHKNYFADTKIDGCLAASSLVETDVGVFPIKDVVEKEIGNFVKSFNESNKKIVYKKILNRIKNGIDVNVHSPKWMKITLQDGRELTLTKNHRIWLPKLNCWRQAKDLTANDVVLLSI